MGLVQTIKFKYSEKAKAIELIKSFSSLYEVNKSDLLWTIYSEAFEPFKIEIGIEDYGFYTHRSGNYFKCFGELIEAISGQFGKIMIEDI